MQATLFNAVRSHALHLMLLCVAIGARGAVLTPEKVLPQDTLLMVTAPDFGKLKSAWGQLSQKQFWDDPAMKPFRDNFVSKWNEQFVAPLERELDIRFKDYASLFQGQVTFAITRGGGEEADSGSIVFLLDARDQSSQLKKNLSALRKKWVDSGRALKTVKLREYEFTSVSLSSNDVPKTLRKFFPSGPETHEAGEEAKPPEHKPGDDLVFGQVDSLLLVTSSVNAAERLVARLNGAGVPPLSEAAAYQQDHLSLFRDAPLYLWVNIKGFREALESRRTEAKENPEAPNPFDVKPEKFMAALGFNGLTTFAAAFRPSRDGSLVTLSLGAPESSRQGLFKILANEPRDTKPPAFVPADVVRFQRWRLDGQKAWDTIQKVLGDISPQWQSGVNFLIDTANTAAREKDPAFDLKKNLIANFGNDIIRYQKRSATEATPAKPGPSLLLMASPNPEVFVTSLKTVLFFAGAQSGSGPEEREFLGRKIYSVSLGSLAGPLGVRTGGMATAPLSYSASSGYVAFSSDPAILEEFLRSSEAQRAALRESPGINTAAERVLGADSSLFGYENRQETLRSLFSNLRKSGAASQPAAQSSSAMGLLPSAISVPGSFRSFRELMDFSLLPDFDAVSKYFSFAVYGASANVDGLALKIFLPAPPTLKNP